ncbi:hypothetical protein CGMCC3_g2669 [Colletotrichum fructicola]|nr:uncharacterized protein CGMCC3_g2669 [Colletotrichum fructicola]KAE9581579.1 hypothetical protein CGMCC3_g2669 [Colletotrichum fructicola]
MSHNTRRPALSSPLRLFPPFQFCNPNPVFVSFEPAFSRTILSLPGTSWYSKNTTVAAVGTGTLPTDASDTHRSAGLFVETT